MERITLKVHQEAIAHGLPLPSYANPGEDAGLDLPTAVDVTIPPHSGADVPTGLRLHIPKGYFVRIIGKGSSAKRGLGFDLESVDQGYTGPLTLFCWNKSKEEVFIPRGKAVAQAVLTPLVYAHKLVVVSADYMDNVRTSRKGGRMNSSKTGLPT